MKKSELIKKLEEFDGDPEIVLWNNTTDTHHGISKVEKDIYVRRSEEHIFSKLEFQEMKKRKSFHTLPDEVIKILRQEAKNLARNEKWDTPNRNIDPEEYKIIYGENQREVVVIEMKKRDEITFDRHGLITY